MNIDADMIRRAMAEMDKRLLAGKDNIWKDACEIARHNIAFEILDAALNGQDNPPNVRDHRAGEEKP